MRWPEKGFWKTIGEMTGFLLREEAKSGCKDTADELEADIIPFPILPNHRQEYPGQRGFHTAGP